MYYNTRHKFRWIC